MRRVQEPIRVLIAMDRLGYGDGHYHGAGRLVVEWSAALATLGHEVTTVVLRSPGDFLVKPNLPIEVLDRGMYDLRTVADFRRLYRERRIQVAHLQGFGSLTFGRLAALRTGIPVIAHVHANHAAETGGYPWFVHVADRCLAPFTDRCLTVSAATGGFAMKMQGFRASRVDVWHNPIDLTAFRPASSDEKRAVRRALGLSLAAPVVVAVARLDRVKGIDLLVQAWPSVVRRIPDARLLIVGDGPGRQTLASAVSEAGVGDSVDFLGYRDDVATVLRAADVATLPSRSEGMPLAALEALACGLPVVAHAVGGIPELIRDGVNGRLVPPDPARLGEMLADVLGDRLQRERLAQQARPSVEGLDLRGYATRLEGLYRSLIDGRRGDGSLRATHPDVPDRDEPDARMAAATRGSLRSPLGGLRAPRPH